MCFGTQCQRSRLGRRLPGREGTFTNPRGHSRKGPYKCGSWGWLTILGEKEEDICFLFSFFTKDLPLRSVIASYISIRHLPEGSKHALSLQHESLKMTDHGQFAPVWTQNCCSPETKQVFMSTVEDEKARFWKWCWEGNWKVPNLKFV